MKIRVHHIVLRFALLAAAAFQVCARADAPPVPPRTIYDVTRLLDDFRPDSGNISALRTVAESTPPEGLDATAQIAFLARRAEAAEQLGLIGRALADRRTLVELTHGGLLEQRYLADLAGLETLAGNPKTGLELRERVLHTETSRTGFFVPTYAALAINAASVGDLDAAKGYLAKAEDLYKELNGRGRGTARRATVQTIWDSMIEEAHGTIDLGEGKSDQAEAHFARALPLIEKDVSIAQTRYERFGGDAPAPFSSVRARNQVEAAYVDCLLRNGKRVDAEMVVRRSLDRSLKELGMNSPQTAVAAGEFARVLLAQNRWPEALAIATRVVRIVERLGVPPESRYALRARYTLMFALFANERWVEAGREIDLMQNAVAGDPVASGLARGSAIEGIVYVKTGRPQQAVERLEPLLRLYSRNLGATAYNAGELRAVLGMAWAAAGDPARGLKEMREAATIMLGSHGGNPDATSTGLRRIKLRIILQAYIELLSQIAGTPLEQTAGLDAPAEAFRIADALRGGSVVQEALSESAARAAAGEPGLKDLIRKEQDLKQEAAALYGFLVRLMSAPPDQQLPKVMTDMRARTHAIDVERARLFTEIEQRFPAYANLISPRPATLDEAQHALKPDEALVSIFSTRDASYVWAVDASGARTFHASKLSGPEIARMVATLRRSLDPGDVDLVDIPRFDLATAHRLYEELLQPAEGVWGRAHTLVVSTGGALAQLPLAVLTTAEPSSAAGRPAVLPLPKEASAATQRKDAGLLPQPVLFEELAQVPWLARRVAIAAVPSVTSLVRLRALPAAASDRMPFAGFGDPQFSRAAVPATLPSAAVRDVRAVALRRLIISRVGGYSDGAKLAAADWTRYSELTPLPDTRAEILSIARVLGADPQRDVFLGESANKRMVKSADLSHRRIVAFATHGLIPGDLPGLTQPALAMSVLDDPQESPLLTLDDVLGLKLDADWVVLSACNTAAGDGGGAEAVSGLGRGFFYAGTRALLVTHWPVETESAKLITTGLFERYAKDPALSRAQALNQSMLALMAKVHRDDKGNADYSYAHPLFWAPYALIGDGAR